MELQQISDMGPEADTRNLLWWEQILPGILVRSSWAQFVPTATLGSDPPLPAHAWLRAGSVGTRLVWDAQGSSLCRLGLN